MRIDTSTSIQSDTSLQGRTSLQGHTSRQGDTWIQWVDQEFDGQLEGSDKARLEELAEADSRVVAEQQALASLYRRIGESKIEVQPGFSARVMKALPQAWWERKAAASDISRWVLPVAMMFALAFGAAGLLASAEGLGPLAGVGIALLDFARVTILAGAGMLFATWRGVGFGLEHLMADSGFNLLALACAVGFLNLLFFSLLRRREPVAEAGEVAAPCQAGPVAEQEERHVERL